MKEECKIVQDLLPSYMEKLTKEETNQYIEKHIKECNHCQKIFEDMQKDWEVGSQKEEKTKVKYLKKYRNRLRLLKFIVAIIAVIMLGILGRKMFILMDLKNKLNDKLNASNYYLKSYAYFGNEITIQESYVKGNKYLNKLYFYPDNSKSIEYYDGKNINKYTDNENEKIAILNQEIQEPDSMYLVKIQNYLYTDNLWEFTKMALNSSIITENCNGKECYRINTNGQILYEDKETGLPVRITTGSREESNEIKIDMVYDFFYKFNSVIEEDFIEPDVSKYKIQS